MKKTYYLVIYDVKKGRGLVNALPSVIDEEAAQVLFQDANPTIERKRGGKFLVKEKRFFEYSNPDGSKTVFIICDAERIINP
tara:strand:+ start:1017 stop:1262 length:246 start_codon:yes stop_codon:yes gene_type:complete